MKKFLILILILKVSIFYSQNNLKGKYCNSFNGGFSSICIEFRENSKFEYSTHGCLGVESIGTGNFSLTSKKLTLNFDKVETKQKSKINTENILNQNNKDSIKLHFKILDGYNDRMPMPATILLGSNSFEYDKGYQVNKSGEVTISKKRNSEKENYRILFIGYESFEFDLSNSSSKKIEIILEPAGPKIISDKTFKYEINKIKDDSIILKDGNKFKKFES
ncbi:hypothetical protein [Christiangramia sp. SM2212]|uniref:Carboxypeptidase-like regulatory domain-containing protein n=1 Tax=Christiangramia sediminicola TaxID=3073267 RepID=A0ABU1ENG6_9FLAO|nr:hypothetical protein [Christiangramia sp. SM2212]MDR5589936.1 hypothetical protein [Christiangramia sp. SM2212]